MDVILTADEPALDDLVERGFALLLGLDTGPLSYNAARDALAAAQRYREYHEVDLRREFAAAMADQWT